MKFIFLNPWMSKKKKSYKETDFGILSVNILLIFYQMTGVGGVSNLVFGILNHLAIGSVQSMAVVIHVNVNI